MRLRKIPLENLINLLADLYDGGADYIDITSEASGSDEPDIMKIIVQPDYLSPDMDDEEEVTQGLSDADINDLI
jgi:hypothetical protein